MLELVQPGDDRYHLSRNQFIGRPDEVLPRTVARCHDTAAVVEALAMVRQWDMPFAIRGGGHSNACHSSSAGMVLDLTPNSSIEVDGNRVTVGAGVRVGQLAEVLAPSERLVPSGSCPSVGLVGAALGGGFGSFGRLHGLTCDHLVSAEVVLADGRVVVVDADHEPELFWALRGAGGGNFRVHTSATFDTVRSVPRTHVRLGWSIEHAPALIRRWQRRALAGRDGVSIELVLLSSDNLDDEAEVLLVGAVSGGASLADFLSWIEVEPRIAEMKDLSASDAALLHATPYSAVAHDSVSMVLASDRPGMSAAKTSFFDDLLPDSAINAVVSHFRASRVRGEMREISFTPWGGAYGRNSSGAFAHRGAAYLVKHTVLVGPRGAVLRGDSALEWVAGSWRAVHPWGNGGAYVNFSDPGLDGWLAAYYGSGVERLRAVKSLYDPSNFFCFAQSIPAGD